MSDQTETHTESPSLADSAAGPADLAFDLDVAEADRYHMIQEVAHGGAGRILLARDRRLGRDVALKEQLRRDRGRDRFVREAVITAQLQHPAIVPVHDAVRRPDGSPFYIMKLVTGESLAEIIAEKSTLAQRLALLPAVITVADAVAYAHSKRIIHRDLKPHNVLIGQFGETTLIDWGLAKRLDEPEPEPPSAVEGEDVAKESTKTGAVIGTPAYMPPEQARGETLDERADVYSLGAMLYFVLAGAPPYTRKEETTILAQVLETEPAALSSHARGIPIELAAIVGKAMARDPSRRYATARALAEDLKRFQAGRLVAAYEYSTWSRIVRTLRRNAAVATVAAVAAAVLAVVGLISVRRIVAERDRSQQQRAAAEELTEFMLAELGEKLRPLGKLDLLDGISDRVAVYYDKLEGVGGLDAGALRRRAKAMQLLSDVRRGQGHQEAAVAASLRGLAYRYLLWLIQPRDRQARAAVADGYVLLSRAKDRARSVEEALTELLVARQILDDLRHEDPGSDDWTLKLVAVLHEMGKVEGDGRLTAQAVAHFEEELALIEPIAARDPTDTAQQLRLARVHRQLAGNLAILGRAALSVDHATRALAIFERVHGRTPEDTRVFFDIINIRSQAAILEDLMGNHRAALVYHYLAVNAADTLAQTEPNNLDWADTRAQAVGGLATTEHQLGFSAQARKHAELAVAILQDLVTKDPANDEWKVHLAEVNLDRSEIVTSSDPALALAACITASELLHAVASKAQKENRYWSNRIARSENCHALALMRLHRLDVAVEHAREAVRLQERLTRFDQDNVEWNEDLGIIWLTLGETQLAKGDHRDAIDSLLHATKVLGSLESRSEFINFKLDYAQAALSLGKAYRGAGDLAAARVSVSEAQHILQGLADQDLITSESAATLQAATEILAELR